MREGGTLRPVEHCYCSDSILLLKIMFLHGGIVVYQHISIKRCAEMSLVGVKELPGVCVTF